MQTPRTRQHGFSLLELVVAMGLFTVIMGVVFQFVAASQTNFTSNQAIADAHQNADFAMLRVSEILRGAGANPANIPSINALSFLKYTTAGSNASVDVLADLNGDGDSADNVTGSTEFNNQFYILSSESVTIRFNSVANTIELVDNTAGGSSSVTLVEHIRNFQVEILQSSREARITITASPSRSATHNDGSFDPTFTAVSDVRLRNRF